MDLFRWHRAARAEYHLHLRATFLPSAVAHNSPVAPQLSNLIQPAADENAVRGIARGIMGAQCHVPTDCEQEQFSCVNCRSLGTGQTPEASRTMHVRVLEMLTNNFRSWQGGNEREGTGGQARCGRLGWTEQRETAGTMEERGDVASIFLGTEAITYPGGKLPRPT